ncbi:MAG: hypothetical protein ACRYGK_00455 [Janthinobacterium lividum]
MTDRELLELAAKAAGYAVRWHGNWQCFVHERPFNTNNPPTLAGQRHVWSPLTDDGDALRLAVALRLQIDLETPGTVFVSNFGWFAFMRENCRNDAEAATRRAIVCAAAEIGRSMQEQGGN